MRTTVSHGLGFVKTGSAAPRSSCSGLASWSRGLLRGRGLVARRTRRHRRPRPRRRRRHGRGSSPGAGPWPWHPDRTGRAGRPAGCPRCGRAHDRRRSTTMNVGTASTPYFSFRSGAWSISIDLTGYPLLRQLLHGGTHLPARPAPLGVEVEQDGLGGGGARWQSRRPERAKRRRWSCRKDSFPSGSDRQAQWAPATADDQLGVPCLGARPRDPEAAGVQAAGCPAGTVTPSALPGWEPGPGEQTVRVHGDGRLRRKKPM